VVADAAVHYPQADEVNRGTARQPRPEPVFEGTADFEREHYHWFVQNDDPSGGRQRGQYLPPLVDARGQSANALPRLLRRQSDDPPATGYSGPQLPPTAPGGGGALGGGANPVAPGGGQGQALGATPSSPGGLAGKPVKATVERYEKKKGKTRIRFRVESEGHVLLGYLAQPDPNRDKATYPEGSDQVHDFTLLNPQKVGDEWHCNLTKL